MKREKIELLVKKRQLFNEKNNQDSQTTVLSANILTTSSLNFSQFGPGAADLELKMQVQLVYFLLLRNREKLKFGGIPV